MEKAGHPKDQAIAASLKKAGLSNKQGEKMATRKYGPQSAEKIMRQPHTGNEDSDENWNGPGWYIVDDDEGIISGPYRSQEEAEQKGYAEGSKVPTAECLPHSEFSSFAETGNGMDAPLNRSAGIRRDRV